MSQRHYLLNTDMLSSDQLALAEAVRNKDAKVVEVAECVYQIPLPWLACFRQFDLRPCAVPMESGENVEIMVPCVDLPTAIRNLRDALPLFERLTGEQQYAREYWQQAIDDLEKLPLPYLTMDVSEMLMNMNPEAFTAYMTSSLAGTDEALDILKDVFIAYYDDVLPYGRAAFYANEGIIDRERIDNTISLDAAIQEDGFGRAYF